MPVVLTDRAGETASLVPVDVDFSVFADECTAPEREIRLVRVENGRTTEVPFQLSRLSRWSGDTGGGESRPTLNGRVSFFDDTPGDGDVRYEILYGNPSAPEPDYGLGPAVSGDGPAWTVRNEVMTVTLHTSGQIASVTLADKPDTPIAPETGILHWNPGVYIPARTWAHAFAWDPPETVDIESGPLFVEITRSGPFPQIPEVMLEITYRIFRGRPYVESSTVMRVRDDVGVVALRNDECVFDAGTFTHLAWREPDGETISQPLSAYRPVNRHGDILRLAERTPMVTFFNPSTGIGAGTVRISSANVGPGGARPVLFDNATYVSNGGHDLMYWFRPLVYFHVGWDRQQLITVPAGSVYAERNLYCFYAVTGERPDGAIRLTDAVANMPSVEIGSYPLPPSR